MHNNNHFLHTYETYMSITGQWMPLVTWTSHQDDKFLLMTAFTHFL